MSGAPASIEFGRTINESLSAGRHLELVHGVPLYRLGTPIGLRENDSLMAMLEKISGNSMPIRHAQARGRLVDSMVDGHKYLFGKKAVVYGEEDLVAGLASFLCEIGIVPVICASGGQSGMLEKTIREVTAGFPVEMPEVFEGADFFDISERARKLAPDLIIGHSKGYPLARELKVPLVRVGFPIHDRMGGQRILHLGYQGAQQLFDATVNALIAKRQDDSEIGYSYM